MQKILKLNSEKEILNNNRLIVNSTSITFHNIISYSKTWYNLNELFHSKKFYFDCLNNFDLNESNFELTHFFYKKKLSDNEIKYKKLINKSFLI